MPVTNKSIIAALEAASKEKNALIASITKIGFKRNQENVMLLKHISNLEREIAELKEENHAD